VALAVDGLYMAALTRWLRNADARPRSYVLLASGCTVYAVATWLALVSGIPLPLRYVAGVVAVAALWPLLGNAATVRRIGGLTPRGELWMLNLEVAEYWNKHGLDRERDPARVDAVRGLLARLEACRTPETAELVDLLVLDYSDRLARTVPSNVLVARAIRTQEIRRRLYPKLAYPPKLETKEAAFRWHLRRALGRVQIAGVTGLDDVEDARFRELVAALDDHRRDDTARLIDLVQQSALDWLADGAGEDWIGHARLMDVGPEVDRLFRAACPDLGVFSGAVLDPEDEALVTSSWETAAEDSRRS
jgi:hypothetical protein